MKKTSLVVLAVFTIFLLWFAGYFLVANPLLLPSPQAALLAFFSLFGNASSLMAIGMTILRLLAALAIAFLLCGALGILGGFKDGFATFFQPVVTMLRTIPVISVIVIILILFGFRSAPYIITFLMIFPLIYQAFHDGIRNLDPELVDVYRLEDKGFFSGIWHCYLPLMRHSLETVMLQSAGLGIKVLVMAEYLSQTRNSIGNALYLSRINLRYDEVFGWTILLIIMAVGLELLIGRFKKLKEKNTLPPASRKSLKD